MNIALILAGGLLAGLATGWVYFLALWATLHGLPRQSHAGLRMVASYFLRLGLMLAVFLALARYTGWQGLVAALFGFLIARTIFVRRIRSPGKEARP
ncbi:MAG: ATP synthase subunit I [Gammaproteobacteria bacterium]|jgi:F1F0 ATPase subunit 2